MNPKTNLYRFAVLIGWAVAISPNAVAQDTRVESHRVTSHRVTSHRPASVPSRYKRAPSGSETFQRKPYRLDGGDVLAIVIEGIVGSFADAQVHFPNEGNGILPSMGTPVVVLPDGTLPLPMIRPVSVRQMTVTEAKHAIADAYVDQLVMNKGTATSVTLMRKRTVNVSFFHDRPDRATGKLAAGSLHLPADRTTVINALVESGKFDPDATVKVSRTKRLGRLTEGAIVQIQSKPAAFFSTGGLIRAGRYSLPSNRAINGLQAIAAAGGVSGQNAWGPRTLSVTNQHGSYQVDYRTLLQNPNAVIVRPGDTLWLR